MRVAPIPTLLASALGLLASVGVGVGVAANAHAKPLVASSTDFTAQARVIPQALLADGYRQVGRLDLQRLLGEIETVQTSVVGQLDYAPGESGAGTTNLRNSAHWRRTAEGRQIRLNGKRWQKTKRKLRPMLALHEHLGALGYRDGEFSCSSALWTLGDERARNILSREERALVEEAARSACQVASNGGSTVVTGGGDSWNVHAKVTLIENALASAVQAPDRASRADAVGKILAAFHRGFEMRTSAPANRKSSADFLVIQGPADPTSLRVFIDGAPVEMSAAQGWSYDPARDPNRVYLHGRAAIAFRNSASNGALFKRAR